jgi:hypothetical protein
MPQQHLVPPLLEIDELDDDAVDELSEELELEDVDDDELADDTGPFSQTLVPLAVPSGRRATVTVEDGRIKVQAANAALAAVVASPDRAFGPVAAGPSCRTWSTRAPAATARCSTASTRAPPGCPRWTSSTTSRSGPRPRSARS